MSWNKQKSIQTNVSKLSDLTDVDATTKIDGYTLQYDTTKNKFVSKALPMGAGGGSTTLPVGTVPLLQLDRSRSGSYNLIDQTKYTDTNKVLTQNGAIANLTNQSVLDYMPALPNEDYVRNFQSPVCFYDVNKVFISGLPNTKQFTVPNNSNIKYLRTSVPILEANPLMARGKEIKHAGFVKYNDSVTIPYKDLRLEKYAPNAQIPLFIETYNSANNQPIHPCVVAFDTAWNGYKYWMAYTPFPYGVSPATENPCIAVSNDVIKWVTPAGLTNPIAAAPTDAGYVNYNSDTHMIYNPDTLKLECWYREVIAKVENIKRVTSSNGTTWSAPELMFSSSGFTNPTTEVAIISPAIVYESGAYKMWVYDNGYVRYYQSSDGFNWIDKGFVTVAGQTYNSGKMQAWHLHVFKNNLGQYEMLNNDGSRVPNQGMLTHFLSTDGLTWTQTDFYVMPTYGSNKWDNNGIYRSCLFQANGKYYMIYTGINDPSKEWKLGLAISTDNSVFTLQGIDITYKPQMAQPTKKNPVASIGDWVKDSVTGKIIYCTAKDDATHALTWVDSSGTVV